MKKNFRTLKIFALIALLVYGINPISELSPKTAYAATYTFVGTGSRTDWNTATNWSPSLVPRSADDVVIPAGTTVTITSGTANFNNLTVNGTFTFTANLNGGNVIVGGTLIQNNKVQQVLTGDLTIRSGGLLTHTVQANGSTLQYSVNFKAQNIILESGGTINVDAKGYAGGGGGANMNWAYTKGYGTGGGGGLVNSSAWTGVSGSGGGYGGSGGWCGDPSTPIDCAAGGSAYGTNKEITDVGSGGGGNNTSLTTTNLVKGGKGGGLVILEALQNTTIEGNILARGEDGQIKSNAAGGGGSGGGVSVKTKGTLTSSTGRIYTTGGSGYRSTASAYAGGGGGSGGRVYLGYGILSGTISGFASGGSGYNTSAAGQSGTVIKEQAYYVPEVGKMGWVGGGTGNWTDASGWAKGGFIETSRVPNENDDVVIALSNVVTIPYGSTANFKSIELKDTATLILEGDIGIGTDITIRNGAKLIQKSKTTRTISGTLTIDAGGILTHEAQPVGSTLTYAVNFSADTIIVNGSIDASDKGFQGGTSTHKDGYGTGAGIGMSGGYYSAGGAGHGGAGSGTYSNSALGGKAYDDKLNPSLPGSGGGSNIDPNLFTPGGAGGGLVQLESKILTIGTAGSVKADGVAGGSKSYNCGTYCAYTISSGGGSGGSITMKASESMNIQGSITAAGGNGGGSSCNYKAGGGGGGLVYLGYKQLTQTGTVTAYGGASAMNLSPYGCFNVSASNGQLTSEQSFPTLPPDLPADANAWIGPSRGNWNEAKNWSQKSVPTSTSKVYITWLAEVTVESGQTANFDSLELRDNATLKLVGNINAGGSLIIKDTTTLIQTNNVQQTLTGDLTVESGGVLTHEDNITQSPGNGVPLYGVYFAAQNINIIGNVDVYGKGFDGGVSAKGNGPGGGNTSNYGYGAGHGGKGGITQTGGVSAPAYGQDINPITAGSGGGGGGGGQDHKGGDGGGLVNLSAVNSLLISGNISASGQDGINIDNGNTVGGGGSGGSINLTGYDVNITGALEAKGGTGGRRNITPPGIYGGAGAGGRVYIKYGVINSPININKSAGTAPLMYPSSSYSGTSTMEGGVAEPPKTDRIEIIGKTLTDKIKVDGISNVGMIDFDKEDITLGGDKSQYAEIAAHLVPSTSAASDYEWRGYAYSDNVGFISFYCGDEAGDGAAPYTNMGYGCGNYEYKILVDGKTGTFKETSSSPYAWNEATGYIKFNNKSTSDTIKYEVKMNVDPLFNDPDFKSPKTLDSDEGLFMHEDPANTYSWAYSQSLGWIEFYKIQALIKGEGSVPTVCEVNMALNYMGEGICVYVEEVIDDDIPPGPGSEGEGEGEGCESTPEGCGDCELDANGCVDADGNGIIDAYEKNNGKVADGVDSYKIHLIFRDKTGAAINRTDFGTKYHAKIIFYWQDTVRARQTASSSGFSPSDPLINAINKPFEKSTNGGIWYKPILLRTYDIDGKFTDDAEDSVGSDKSGNSLLIGPGSKENILSTSPNWTWTSSNELVVEVKAIAPTTAENTSVMTGEKYFGKNKKVNNNNFRDIDVPFKSLLSGNQEDKLVFNGIHWELLNLSNLKVASGDVLGAKVRRKDKPENILGFKPKYEINILNAINPTGGTDYDTIFAYRGIPVDFDLGTEGVKDNSPGNTSSLYRTIGENSAKIAFNLFYNPPVEDQGFAFSPIDAVPPPVETPENTTAPTGEVPEGEVVTPVNTAGPDWPKWIQDINYYNYHALPNLIISDLKQAIADKEEGEPTWLPLKASLDPRSDYGNFQGTGDFTTSATLYTEISQVIEIASGYFKTVSYYSNHLPRTIGIFANPVAKILGNIYAQIAFTPNKNRQTTGIGDTSVNIVRDTVFKNLQKLIRGQTMPERGDETTITDLNSCTADKNCLKISISNTKYLEEVQVYNTENLILAGSSKNMTWDQNKIIVVLDGNLFVKNNLYNGNSNNGLGIIVTRDTTEPGSLGRGHMYVDASVTNLQAVTMVLDGSLFSWELGLPINSENGEPVWGNVDKPERLYKQLLIEGALSSRNTIGGAEARPMTGGTVDMYRLGTGEIIPANKDGAKERAQLYDLNFLRFFRLKVEIDGAGNPIDKSCDKALTEEDFANLAAGTPVTNGDKTCNGIDATCAFGSPTCSGDLVATDENSLAQGVGLNKENPVVIKYIPPSNKSFMFSIEKNLTF